jgi:threonine synthase
MIEAVYDLERVRLVKSDNPFVHFGQLLPVQDNSLLPSDRGYTPCVLAERLGRELKLARLYLKNETVLPTGSTKDRSASVTLSLLLETGARRFATSSTGNAGTAYAYAMQQPQFSEMEMHLFLGEAFHLRNHCGDSQGVHTFVLTRATFVEAGAVAATYAAQRGILTDGGFFSPGKREGAKLAYFEATEQVPTPIDWYVQAISSGLGVHGTYKGAKELLAMGHVDRLPRLLCVQEDTCAPQVRAFEDGYEKIQPWYIVHDPFGLAIATHRGDPSRAYPYMRHDVLESNGAVAVVSEREIRDARQMIRDLEGIDICFSSAAAAAGLIQKARAGVVGREETVLLNLTGRDRQPELATKQNVTWLRFGEDGWASDDGTISIPEDQAMRRRHDRRRSEPPFPAAKVSSTPPEPDTST